jgi:hypothetical protein
MVKKEQAIEALMRELAVSELRLVPCMNEKVKDVGELCKSILELVDKSSSSPLKYAEKFALFHILARQMFKSELHSNPEFEEVCKFLVSYFMVKSIDSQKLAKDIENFRNENAILAKEIRK